MVGSALRTALATSDAAFPDMMRKLVVANVENRKLVKRCKRVKISRVQRQDKTAL
jgi:hypothetical protein